MKKEELTEFHYITLTENVASILRLGILSNNMAKKERHYSCASSGVQERRDNIIVPGGRALHDYANLYFNARNPMMYYLAPRHNELSIVVISPEVIDLVGVIITDQNASREFTLFKPAPDGLKIVDRELVFANSWVYPSNDIKTYDHKGKMCAELLVPNKIDAKYIKCIYVSSEQSRQNLITKLGQILSGVEISINQYLFFR